MPCQLFKQRKVGTLVGKRTWGGPRGNQRDTRAHGRRARDFAERRVLLPKGEWDVENLRSDPDVPVEQDPKAVSQGHDPQLETAVEIALRELKANPPAEPAKPAYPSYRW